MNRASFMLTALMGLLLVSATPALSRNGSAKIEGTSLATLRLVQCALSGNCIATTRYILSEIEGVRDVTVRPTSEFEVEYDPRETTPEKIARTFNGENSGSRVLLQKEGAQYASKSRGRR